MQTLLQKTITLRLWTLIILCLVLVVILATVYSAYTQFYMSDHVPSLDCMTINRGYLRHIRDLYGERADFDATIWPRAIEVAGEMNGLCFESIEGEGLITRE